MALGVVGGASLAVGLLGRWGALLQLALSLLLVQYLALLLGRDELDGRAPLVGAGLIVVAELAYAGLEPPATRRGLARTAVVTLLLAGGAAALGALLLAAAAASSGTLVEATVGILAAAGAIALVAWLAWTSRR